MEKIDSKQTVYELVKERPALKKILVTIGLTPLNNDAMLNTVGRMMSLDDGIKQVNLSRKELIDALKEGNYELKEEG